MQRLTVQDPRLPAGEGPWAPAPIPPTPLAAWRDPTFLYFKAANLVLHASVGLFRAGLLPRSALMPVLDLTQRLSRRGHRRWQAVRRR